MQRKSRKPKDRAFDLDALLHPAHAFDHPDDVVNDTDLTRAEKRAILAAWAADSCALDAAPTLRPPGAAPVSFDDIAEALRTIDRQAEGRPRPRYRGILDERVPGVFGRETDDGQSLH